MRWDREAIAISRSPYLAGSSRVVKELFSPAVAAYAGRTQLPPTPNVPQVALIYADPIATAVFAALTSGCVVIAAWLSRGSWT